MNQQDRYDAFCELLTRYQGHIRGYILALVRNRADADDLFQATSLVLWRKFDTFEPESNFFAWARKTADFTVRNFWRTNHSRFTPLSEAFLETLAATEPYVCSDAVDSYLAGLRHCIDKLRQEDRDLLNLSYMDDLSAQQIADRIARSRQSVSKSLLRIRRGLLGCIQKQLVKEGHP
jgi:RNA polymerase sigma-70 factor, ECF subfamily